MHAAFSQVFQWQCQAKLSSRSDETASAISRCVEIDEAQVCHDCAIKCGRAHRILNRSSLQMEKRQLKNKRLLFYLEVDLKTNWQFQHHVEGNITLTDVDCSVGPTRNAGFQTRID